MFTVALVAWVLFTVWLLIWRIEGWDPVYKRPLLTGLVLVAWVASIPLLVALS